MKLNKLKERIDTQISKKINESSLSRIYEHWKIHDTGTISAFRSKRDCNKGIEYTRKENNKRNSILRGKLLKLGYGVTKIQGSYIENYKTKNAIEVNEISFLVVDLKDTKQLKKDLVKLGTEFEQDSITFSIANGKYYIISSNECIDGYPGNGRIGVEVLLGSTMFGENGEFFSKIHGRPFVFKESLQLHQDVLRKLSMSEIKSAVAYSKMKIT